MIKIYVRMKDFLEKALTVAGRLVIKDTAILAGAVVVLSDSARSVLRQLKG